KPRPAMASQTAQTERYPIQGNSTLSQNAVTRRLRESLFLTESYLVGEQFRGYDPYDGLSSPLFRSPLLRGSSHIRAAAQQLLKGLPVNLRPLLGIGKGYNPVTLGLALRAYAQLAVVEQERVEYFRGR